MNARSLSRVLARKRMHVPTADPRAQERIGTVLHDKWTLESLLGEGGMGAVYLARHRNGARAAVKVLAPGSARQPHIRKRFLQEGYAANRVDHPNAVKVLDDDVIQEGPDEGTAYLVMELLEGESLHQRAQRDPPLGERDLLEVAYEVLAVLDAAHTNGVVHRDLKPDNLFLARDSERDGTIVKVLDFGLARLLEAGESTIAGMALGTPTYMSPEQAAGHVSEIDGRTDIYALGSILFQLVSNRRIHDAGHTLGLVIRMATTPAPKLRTVAPDVSEPFARIVDHALEFKREDRYPSAASMRADVKAALDLLRGTESTSLNVLTAMPAGVPPSAPLVSPALAPQIGTADTVVGHKAAAAARAATGVVASPSSRPPSSSLEEQQPRGLPMRSFVLFALLTLAALGVWRNASTIQGWLSASTTASTSAVPPPQQQQQEASPDSMDDASVSVTSSAVTDEDSSAAASLAAGDAAVVDDLDGGGDGGEDDDDDEEDDVTDASSPDDGAPIASEQPHRRVVNRTGSGAHPTRKKTPRRPGTHPRTNNKKRWHW